MRKGMLAGFFGVRVCAAGISGRNSVGGAGASAARSALDAGGGCGEHVARPGTIPSPRDGDGPRG